MNREILIAFLFLLSLGITIYLFTKDDTPIASEDCTTTTYSINLNDKCSKEKYPIDEYENK